MPFLKKRKARNTSEKAAGAKKPRTSYPTASNQATLLYATPAPSQAAETKDQSTQATDNTTYDDGDEITEAEGEKTTKRFTIHAKDRLSFEVDFQLYREFGVYQPTP